MLDHCTRTGESENSFGILMGVIGNEGSVDIRTCFPLRIIFTENKVKLNDEALI